MSQMPMQAHLEKVRQMAEENIECAKGFGDRLDTAQLHWKPDPESWSVGQCLDHLTVTADVYHPQIRKALEWCRNSGKRGMGEYRPSWWGKLFLRYSGPKVRMKIKAFQMFRPREANDGRAVERFCDRQQEFLGLIETARGADLNAAKIQSPQSRFIRLSLGEVLEVLVAHQRRHIEQARRVMRARRFPRRLERRIA